MMEGSPKQPVLLLLLLLSGWSVEAGSVWPKPLNQTCTGKRLLYLHSNFKFASRGYRSPILDGAFCRYHAIIHDAPPSTPPPADTWHEEVRVRESGIIRRVRVVVTSYDQSLNLDTNEGYTLDITAPTTTIQATTVYGALRGLETLAQMVDVLSPRSYGEGWLPPHVQMALAGSDNEGEGPSDDDADDEGDLLPKCPDSLGHKKRRRHHHNRRRRRKRLLSVEECSITDAPRFRHRGLLIDTARHFLPVSVIKDHLDAMAASKLNVLHWHIVDDQSFPLVVQELPLLSQKGAFRQDLVYTALDVQEVVEYARARGIRVVPELDTPGHTLSWGRGYPQLLTPCYNAQGLPSGEFGPMNPARPETYAALWRLLREVARLFPDAYVHVGGDEVDFSCWRSNPEIRRWMEIQGWGSDYSRAEEYFMTQVLRLAASAGKSYIVWQEVLDNGVHVRDDTVVQVWKWWADSPADAPTLGVRSMARSLLARAWDLGVRLQLTLFPGWGQQQQQQGQQQGPGREAVQGGGETPAWASELDRVTKAGYRALLSAPWYLNLGAFAGEDWAAYYQVEPLLGLNATSLQAELVVGGEACMWGEYVDATNAIPRTWPRAAAVAERLWSDASVRDEEDARRRLQEHRCRLLARGVEAAPLGPGMCAAETAD